MNSKNRRSNRRSIWKLAGLLLTLGVALGVQAEPPSFKLPGRQPDSTEPWGAFLGRAAHYVIGRRYSMQYPNHVVFLNTASLFQIVKKARLGDPQRLSEFVKLLCPDITDTDALVLFEIKPDNEEALRQGREQAGRYLEALNAVVAPENRLAGGTGFDGSLFLEFEDGGVLWQLSWRTPEPGVTLYRWSSRRKKPNASWQERADQREEALSRKEGEQRGELAEQAIRWAYEGGKQPAGSHGRVYLPVDCH